MTARTLVMLAQDLAEAKAALDAGIVAERAKGRSLRSIGADCGLSASGVKWVVDNTCPGCVYAGAHAEWCDPTRRPAVI